jgi:excisionase family DNA binding protein
VAADLLTPLPQYSRGSPSDRSESDPKCDADRESPAGRRKTSADFEGEKSIPASKRALTVNEAARVYSISRSSLYKLIGDGTIPDLIVAGRRLISIDAMEGLISGAPR